MFIVIAIKHLDNLNKKLYQQVVSCVCVLGIYAGAISVDRLYDKIDDYACAQTKFITHSSVIALVLPPETVKLLKKILCL